MHTVRLECQRGEKFLRFDLEEVLRAIPASVAETLRWSILWFSGRGDGCLALEQQARSSERGIVTDWEGMLSISERIRQTYDALFVGSYAEAAPPIRAPDGELLNETGVAVVVDAVDSTYWLISTRDNVIIESIRKAFESNSAVKVSVPAV